MPKRKNKDLKDLLGAIGGFAVLILMGLWFTDKTKFYIYISVILLVLVAAIFILIKIKKHRFNNVGKWHSGRDLLRQLRSMRPNQFEDYIADLYSRLGYKTERVGGSYDGGIDVIAIKSGIKHYIQCKKYITSKVGVSEMRDFYGAMAGKLSKGKGIFITTNIFTTEADRFAGDKPIELIDGDRLLKLIKTTKKDKDEIEIQERVCPKCDGCLTEKKSKYGAFLGCSNYPQCKHTENIYP